MSRGIVFVHEDGKTFEMAPLQVFISGGGQTVIRIGRNALFFNQDGTLDGSESHVSGLTPDSPEVALIQQAFELQGQNKGLSPDDPYFVSGTPGHAAETRSWGAAKREEDKSELYMVGVKKPVEH